MNRKQKLALAIAAAAAVNAGEFVRLAKATDIYTETWSGGTIPANYTTVSTTTSTMASIVGGVLTTDNGNPGATGNIRVFTNTTGGGSLYDPSFNPSFDLNGDGNLMTWNLNLQESRSNPSGFANTNSGVAYILGASDSSFLTAGEGYAVTIGSTLTDPVCLIHYTAGLAAVGLNAKSSPFNMITGPTDASTKYMSVRVTYAPGSNTWKMFLRDDGTGGFTDAIASPVVDSAIAGSLVQAASATVMSFSGFVQTHTTTANNLGRFDNIKLAIDLLPPTPPRNLIWDANATGAATDGSGTWSTANSWIDLADNTTHVNWEDGRPDNATFGTGTGTSGSATVTLSGPQTAGLVTFAASSTSYDIAGGTLSITGYDDDANPATAMEGMIVQQSTTLDSTLNWLSAAHLHVNGSGTTLTLNGPLSGSGNIDKYGTGTVLINAIAPSRSGSMDIETGTVKVASSAMSGAGGVSGLGTGQTTVHSGATLWLDASTVGGTGAVLSGAAGVLSMGDGGTLKVTGTVTYQKNNPEWANGEQTAPKNSTIHVDSASTLVWRAQLKNSSTTAQNYHTIHMDGPGTVKITNSGSDASGDSSLYSGDWDLSNGTLILGQNTETGGSAGDTLNALGFKNGDTKNGNTITVSGPGTLIGTENDNNAIPNDPPGVITFYRGRVILAGGNMASGNGKDTSWGANFTTAAATSSKILTYDPLNPATPRSTTLVRGPADLNGNQADTVWNGNLTIDPGSTTSGAFTINRDVITSSVTANPTGIAVTPGATITVLQGATLNLMGTADALSDGTNNVNIVNQSSTSFNVSNGTKNVGTVDGTGTTTVATDGVLVATHMIQGTVNLNGAGSAHIRPSSLAAGVSNIRTLNVDTVGGAKLNLEDNKLVTANARGTWNGSAYTDVTGLIAMGRGSSNLWDGSAGIVTTQSNAVGTNYNSIGVAKASDVRPATATATDLWAGQTITGTDTLVMYTYGGDATLDGKINIDDYVKIDSGIAGNYTGWSNGDFNYDGKINIDDYTTIIDANIGNQTGVFYTSGGLGDGGGSGVTAVPEPASLGLLALGATALLARRRRRE